jgi:hypothetical protein
LYVSYSSRNFLVFHPTDVPWADRGSEEFMGWAGSDMMSSEFMVCDGGLVVRRGWFVVVVLGKCWECEGAGRWFVLCMGSLGLYDIGHSVAWMMRTERNYKFELLMK